MDLPEDSRVYTGENVRKNTNSLTRALGNYLSVMRPVEMQEALRRIYWSSNRYQKLKYYRQYKPKIDKLRTLYPPVILARNEMMRQNYHQSFLEFWQQKFGIPQEDYRLFLNKSGSVINYLNSLLPEPQDCPPSFGSKYNNRCFLCQIKSEGLKVPEDVLSFMGQKFPELKKRSQQIRIVFADQSQMKPNPEDGSFIIEINKNSGLPHQAADLIHELSHVLRHLKGKQVLPESTIYQREKETIRLELTLLREFSPSLWKAKFGVMLETYWRAFFEIESFTHPSSDLDRLYAKLFNRCFAGGHQAKNDLYLINAPLIMQPFQGLPAAVAYTILLSEQIKDVVNDRVLETLRN